MRKIFLLGLIALCNLCFAQITRFVYEANMKLSKEKQDKHTEIFLLDTSPQKSVFYSENNIKRDSIMRRMRDTRSFNPSVMENFRNTTNYVVEKDLINQTIIFRDRVGRDNYIYTENPNLDWKLTQEVTQIGDYKVQKAQTHYAGREWIAWFTTDLPYIDGPYKFYGLPGLIIKLEDNLGDYSFDLKEIKKIDDFVNLNNGMGQTIKITREKFKNLQKNYIQDPSSYMMMGGNRPPRNNNNDSERREREKRMIENIKSKNNLIELD